MGSTRAGQRRRTAPGRTARQDEMPDCKLTVSWAMGEGGDIKNGGFKYSATEIKQMLKQQGFTVEDIHYKHESFTFERDEGTFNIECAPSHPPTLARASASAFASASASASPSASASASSRPRPSPQLHAHTLILTLTLLLRRSIQGGPTDQGRVKKYLLGAGHQLAHAHRVVAVR